MRTHARFDASAALLWLLAAVLALVAAWLELDADRRALILHPPAPGPPAQIVDFEVVVDGTP